MNATTFPNFSCRKPIGGNMNFVENRTVIGEISTTYLVYMEKENEYDIYT